MLKTRKDTVLLFDMGGVLIDYPGAGRLLRWMPEGTTEFDDTEINVSMARETGMNAFRVRGTRELKTVLHMLSPEFA
jgi:hypothetical protein